MSRTVPDVEALIVSSAVQSLQGKHSNLPAFLAAHCRETLYELDPLSIAHRHTQISPPGSHTHKENLAVAFAQLRAAPGEQYITRDDLLRLLSLLCNGLPGGSTLQELLAEHASDMVAFQQFCHAVDTCLLLLQACRPQPQAALTQQLEAAQQEMVAMLRAAHADGCRHLSRYVLLHAAVHASAEEQQLQLRVISGAQLAEQGTAATWALGQRRAAAAEALQEVVEAIRAVHAG